MRLILVTTLFKDSADKLDRFLRYYQRFQFDDVIVVENDEDFTEESKCKKEREGIIEHLDGLLDDTWVCYADLDEFQEYPISLYRSIQQAEDLGFDFLEGRLIDRLSMDGRLVPEREPLELTFPVGAFVTRVLMNGWDKKIMAAKASVALGGGHHVRKNKGGLRFNNYDVQPYVPELAPFCYGNWIRHFKWSDELLPKFRDKYSKFTHPSLQAWRQEHLRLIGHVDDNYGRINVEREDLQARLIEPKLNI